MRGCYNQGYTFKVDVDEISEDSKQFLKTFTFNMNQSMDLAASKVSVVIENTCICCHDLIKRTKNPAFLKLETLF